MDKVSASRMREWYDMWLRSESSTLLAAYGKPSITKIERYKYCRKLFYALDGEFFRILSRNQLTFTVGFRYRDKDTGVLMFRVETKDHSYTMPVSEILG